MANDYYDILGVQRDASQEEIRKAYLKLAHKYHPDKTGGDKAAEEKLKQINEAYDTLKNKEKRAQYDHFGQAGANFGGAGGFGGFGGFGDFGFGGTGHETAFDDFFDVLFGRGANRGGGPRGRTARAGADLQYHLSITLREAAFGADKPIHFNRMETCSECSGSGAASGSQPLRCADCGGSGQIRRAQGFFSISQTCPRCRGQGWVIEKPCQKCAGGGRVRTQRELTVTIPPGVDTGSRLRIPGEGEPGENHGPRGDLYILVDVKPDEIFERSGNDIVCEVPISFAEAALGAAIRVPTLKGEAELKVPAGTQPGATLRLRGLGVPDIHGYHRGDQIVKVQVEVPTKLSREEREIIKKLQEVSDSKTHPLHRRFMEKLRKSVGG